MAALFEVEGMLEDGHGTGLFRLAVVTEHEGKLPDVSAALGKRAVVIRTVRLVDAPMTYRPGTLPVSPNVDVLYDELKQKRYRREGGLWKAVGNKTEEVTT